jgi:TolB-like protein/class 3 adenylate cyclase/Flp pilus assembly protein TadD
MRMERRLAAILAADVVGYSRLMNRDEAGTLAALKSHRGEVIDPQIAEHNGRIVKLMGDGVLTEFASVVDAVTCAVEIQQAMAGRNAEIPEDERIAFRIGINLGDIIVEGEDIYGDGVNIAARLEGLAEPGGVCISDDVYRQISNKLDFAFKDLGDQKVKNIPQPVRAYEVLIGSGESGITKPAARSKRPVMWAAGLAAMVAVGGLFWFEPWTKLPNPDTVEQTLPSISDKPSVAVLPFDNLSNDPEQDFFADGLTEDLITDLSKISGLFVIARNSSFVYKNKPVPIQQISRELGVQFVLEGSVRKSGGKIRINAQLVDGATGGHLWAERYDRDYKNIFSLQDEIIGKIAQALKVTLTVAEQQKISRQETDDLEAYEFFLKGRQQYVRRSRDGNRLAQELLEKAIARDPEFARAYALLARAHSRDFVDGWSESPEASLDRALDIARTAVALDSSSPQSHMAMADALRFRGETDEAVAAAKKAVELDPNFADGYALLAQTLAYAGEPERGLEMIGRAMLLNPRPSYAYLGIQGQNRFALELYGPAIVSFEGAVALNPEVQRMHLWLAASYARVGRQEDAEWEVEEIQAINPDASLTNTALLLPFGDPAHRRNFLDALRLAGMPE